MHRHIQTSHAPACEYSVKRCTGTYIISSIHKHNIKASHDWFAFQLLSQQRALMPLLLSRRLLLSATAHEYHSSLSAFTGPSTSNNTDILMSCLSRTSNHIKQSIVESPSKASYHACHSIASRTWSLLFLRLYDQLELFHIFIHLCRNQRRKKNQQQAAFLYTWVGWRKPLSVNPSHLSSSGNSTKTRLIAAGVDLYTAARLRPEDVTPAQKNSMRSNNRDQFHTFLILILNEPIPLLRFLTTRFEITLVHFGIRDAYHSIIDINPSLPYGLPCLRKTFQKKTRLSFGILLLYLLRPLLRLWTLAICLTYASFLCKTLHNPHEKL